MEANMFNSYLLLRDGVGMLPVGYENLKSKYDEYLLVFRDGEIYTAFDADAREIGRILNIDPVVGKYNDESRVCIEMDATMENFDKLMKVVKLRGKLALCEPVENEVENGLHETSK